MNEYLSSHLKLRTQLLKTPSSNVMKLLLKCQNEETPRINYYPDVYQCINNGNDIFSESMHICHDLKTHMVKLLLWLHVSGIFYSQTFRWKRTQQINIPFPPKNDWKKEHQISKFFNEMFASLLHLRRLFFFTEGKEVLHTCYSTSIRISHG